MCVLCYVVLQLLLVHGMLFYYCFGGCFIPFLGLVYRSILRCFGCSILSCFNEIFWDILDHFGGSFVGYFIPFSGLLYCSILGCIG